MSKCCPSPKSTNKKNSYVYPRSRNDDESRRASSDKGGGRSLSYDCEEGDRDRRYGANKLTRRK